MHAGPAAVHATCRALHEPALGLLKAWRSARDGWGRPPPCDPKRGSPAWSAGSLGCSCGAKAPALRAMIKLLPAWHAVSGAPGARQPAAGVAVNGTYQTSLLSAAASSRSTGLLLSRRHAVLHEALPRRNMYADVCAGRCPGAQQQHHQAPAAPVPVYVGLWLI